ncbi:hypothetical protein Ciccas_003522 [Cichlidogyrus casuarinus]|uniref:Uncharacterized protein n=1 Tax=Cichlidogyrus casuarinus TaxID=1844966 RepID=A0ABD2QEK5_9PLAT
MYGTSEVEQMLCSIPADLKERKLANTSKKTVPECLPVAVVEATHPWRREGSIAIPRDAPDVNL